MELVEILKDKSLKSSEKPGLVSMLLQEQTISIKEVLEAAQSAKDPDKATLIEAVEHASLKNPDIISAEFFHFAIESLSSNAPRVKWESARVIANTAKCFPALLPRAVTMLLANTEHPGTVVRWSAATALGAIIKLRTDLNDDLIPAIQAIIEREEKNSIRKIYMAAIKKR